ncbi:MAG: hypothetical protein J5699_00500 [Bacteroidales bacterium]|nr:hypothetical protein [Bacteroidales bacterium]
MKQKLIYEIPRVEVVEPLPAGTLCASNVDAGGMEVPFPGFNPEQRW